MTVDSPYDAARRLLLSPDERIEAAMRTVELAEQNHRRELTMARSIIWRLLQHLNRATYPNTDEDTAWLYYYCFGHDHELYDNIEGYVWNWPET